MCKRVLVLDRILRDDEQVPGAKLNISENIVERERGDFNHEYKIL